MRPRFLLWGRFEEVRDRSQEPVGHVDEWDSDSLAEEVGTFEWLVVVQHRCAVSQRKSAGLNTKHHQPVAPVAGLPGLF